MTGAVRRDFPVLLISMPFADLDRPSIQLGLLKAVAAAHGFRVRTRHAGLDLAARIGPDPYRRLAGHRGRQVGGERLRHGERRQKGASRR